MLGRVGTVIKKTAEVADNLDKIRKAVGGGYTLAASVGSALLTWAQHFPK